METKQGEKPFERSGSEIGKKLRDAVKQAEIRAQESEERRKYKVTTIFVMSLLSIWAAKYTLTGLAALIRAYKDFRKSLRV